MHPQGMLSCVGPRGMKHKHQSDITSDPSYEMPISRDGVGTKASKDRERTCK